jgi:DNA-binding transcriptional regulator YhcF (GntR family)
MSQEYQTQFPVERDPDGGWFVQVPQNFLMDEQVKTYHIAIYTVLMSFADVKKRQAFPSVGKIANMTGLTRKTARKYLQELAQMGYITIHKRSIENEQTSNLYVIHTHPQTTEKTSQEHSVVVEQNDSKNAYSGVSDTHASANNTHPLGNVLPNLGHEIPNEVGTTFPTVGEEIPTNYTQLTIPNITRTNEQENDIQPTAGGASHRDRARENSEINSPQDNGVGDESNTPKPQTDNPLTFTDWDKVLDQVVTKMDDDPVEKPEPIEYPDAYTQRIVAVQDAFKLNPSDTGFAKVLEAQLTGRSKKGKRGEFALEKPMNAHEILAFGEWWANLAMLNEWSQKTPPTSAEALYERALEFRSHRNYLGAIRQSSLRLDEKRIEPDPSWVEVAHLHPPVRY